MEELCGTLSPLRCDWVFCYSWPDICCSHSLLCPPALCPLPGSSHLLTTPLCHFWGLLVGAGFRKGPQAQLPRHAPHPAQPASQKSSHEELSYTGTCSPGSSTGLLYSQMPKLLPNFYDFSFSPRVLISGKIRDLAHSTQTTHPG